MSNQNYNHFVINMNAIQLDGLIKNNVNNKKVNILMKLHNYMLTRFHKIIALKIKKFIYN
jgi:hypothetical protein